MRSILQSHVKRIAATAMLLLASTWACAEPRDRSPEAELSWLLDNAITPTMPGDWALLGCDFGTIEDKRFGAQEGYTCQWQKRDEGGTYRHRTEWFDLAGELLATSNSIAELLPEEFRS